MMLKKNPSWEEAIRLELEIWCLSPMNWGKDDCALAIANIDRKVLGIDTAAAWRGRYRSERGAKRVLGKGGLPKTLLGVAKRLGWVKVSPSSAPPGSRGLCDNGLGPTVMIKYHDRFWVGRSDRGFAAVDDASIKIAWTVN